MCLFKEALKNGNEEELVEIVVVVVVVVYILYQLRFKKRYHCFHCCIAPPSSIVPFLNHDVVVHWGLHLSVESCCCISWSLEDYHINERQFSNHPYGLILPDLLLQLTNHPPSSVSSRSPLFLHQWRRYKYSVAAVIVVGHGDTALINSNCSTRPNDEISNWRHMQ